MRKPLPVPRGIALIEALVALTVTAVGLVSVLGVQLVLRQNADLAKQRSEAVRLAQEEIENWRSFATVTGAAQPGSVTYAALDTGANLPVTGSNTQFTVSRRVTVSAMPAYKTLAVTVDWVDRTAAAQAVPLRHAVQLNTTIAAVAPELGATVVVPADGRPTSRAGGRAFGIPRDAKRLSATESGFRPPQDPDAASAQVWKINNTTGFITICTTTAATNETLSLANISGCLPGRAQLLSGFVRFALHEVGGVPRQPTAADAALSELPLSPAPVQTAEVKVFRTLPTALEVTCFVARRGIYLSYFCAVPVDTGDGSLPIWSGRAVVLGLTGLTDNATEASATGFRVCRYTRYDSDRAVGTGTPPMTNEDHPLDYANVGGPVANQNYLVTRAGNGSVAFGCPADDLNTLLNTTTRAHPLGL